MVKKQSPKKTRSSYPKITEFLRTEIVQGRLAPGSLLPPRLQLLKKFDAAPATIQEAIHQLREEGFLETSSPRCGTRVVQMPPHLYHYKLVFPPSKPFGSPYFQALIKAAERLEKEGNFYFSEFHGVGGPGDVDAYDSLLQEIHKHRIAGLFFATNGSEYRNTPLFSKPDIPRFAVAEVYDLTPDIPRITFDLESFFIQAASILKAKGKRKVLVLNLSDYIGGQLDAILEKTLRAAGLDVPSHWIQFVEPRSYVVSHCLDLVFQGGKEKPDAVIITDDNLVEIATKLLSEKGRHLPRTLEVVAHANFPNPTKSHIPAVRVGYDIQELLERGMRSLLDQRAGKKVEIYERLLAVSEEDLPGSHKG